MKLAPPERVNAPAATAERPPSSRPSPAAPTAPAQDPGDVERAVARANVQMAAVSPSLQFEVDRETRRVVIRLVDREDRQVLRQVPAQEMLDIARALDRMQAHLVRGKA